MESAIRTVPHARPRAHPPASGVLFVVAGTSLAAFSIATGILDIGWPALTSQPRFEFLIRAAETLGPEYLFLHIFLHNLGLALIVPSVGLLAAAFERNPAARRWLGPVLAFGVLGSLLAAVELVLRRGYWREEIVMGLLLVECGAVLLATWAGLRSLRGYVPTRKPAWSWWQPVREMAPYAAVSAIALAFGAFVETLYLAKTLGL